MRHPRGSTGKLQRLEAYGSTVGGSECDRATPAYRRWGILPQQYSLLSQQRWVQECYMPDMSMESHTCSAMWVELVGMYVQVSVSITESLVSVV